MDYELTIEPHRGWMRIPWREILEYRDLLFLLVRRDFLSQYKQTVLGPLWFVIQPLITTIVFTVVFGKVAKIPTDGLPPMLFYLCGTMAWGYFSGCLGQTSSIFLSNVGIFGKVYFPRLIIPLSAILSRLIAFGVQLGTFLVFLLYFKFLTPAGATIHPGLSILLVPLLLLQSAALGMGVGLWISALTTRYRDFGFLSGFMTQLWMYATPVVYPLSVVPEQWRWAVSLNPMAVTVEAYRKAFFGVGTLDWPSVVAAVSITVLLLISGVAVFGRAERTFIDTV